jgi:hypothetical protein
MVLSLIAAKVTVLRDFFLLQVSMENRFLWVLDNLQEFLRKLFQIQSSCLHQKHLTSDKKKSFNGDIYAVQS